MSRSVILYLNGRCTGATGFRALVRNKTASAGAGTNFWSSTENNQNNAWNVNFNNGNMNNNNKYNTYNVRPLAALEEDYIIEWINALIDCCRNKKSTNQCTLYRLRAVDLITLAWEVLNGVYEPGTSITFIVTHPKLREIFAAMFRDRIVQHWIVIRIEPLLEQRFIEDGDVSYNCRKGYGTLAATQKLQSMVEDVSRNYTSKAYIGRYDIHSFFMSIDVRILWKKLEPFIRERYHGDDIDMLLYLLEKTIFHRPQDNCIRKGDTNLWRYLNPSKSLFHAEDCIGMPIGNITSQLLANFYLSGFDGYMMSLCDKAGARYVRFVDDFTIVATNPELIKTIAKKAEIFLRKELHLQLHPDKVYMQEVRHGVKFVGTVIKPGRTYLSNSTIGKLVDRLRQTERLCKRIMDQGTDEELLVELERSISGINSYLGFACHNSCYSLLYKNFTKLSSFWHVCHVGAHFHVVKINRKFQLKQYYYDSYVQFNASTSGRGRALGKRRDAYYLGQSRHPGGRAGRKQNVFLRPGCSSACKHE